MTPEMKEKIAGRRVVASVSGGKDSAAMSLWLTEQGIEHDRVFMDTGWEHPATYEYLEASVADSIKRKVAARGEVLRDVASASFFSNDREGRATPIDEVVEWSKTDRGGKQYMLLDPSPDAGCMRWGLCDTASEQPRADAAPEQLSEKEPAAPPASPSIKQEK